MSFDRKVCLISIAVLGGSIFSSFVQPAQASPHDNRLNFRTFRDQNPGVDRHTARRMFQADRRIADPSNGTRLNSIDPVSTMPQGPGGFIRCGTDDPSMSNKSERRAARNIEKIGNQSLQVQDNAVARLSSGVELDLTSTVKNITLGKNLFQNGDQIEITVDGQTKAVGAGSQVTAAEYVAVKQVIAGSGQTVKLNSAGAAVGGEVDLGALTPNNDVMRATDLVVAANVTTVGDFGRHSDFRLSGDLTNYGTVHTLSSDDTVRGGTIHADDISNHAGAVISSSVDLNLDATGSISNDGTIVSDRSLSLSAGTSLTNSGTIAAQHDVTLNTPTVTNSGAISSATANINLGSQSDLVVDNHGGTMSALNGGINVRDSAYAGVCNSTINGGDLLSRELNLNSGQGLSSVNVNQLTGVVNESGTAAHVFAATDELKIGSVCLTGDPTFYNQGDMAITANVTVAEDLVFVAAGNISVNSGVIISAGNANQGFDVTLIAGADFVPSGGSNSPTVPPTTNPGGVSLSGAPSGTGGFILMQTGSQINARSTDASGNDIGGDISMFAFGGKSDVAGVISISGGSLFTGGKNTGTNGDVTLVAGGKAEGSSIRTGRIDTLGSVGSIGNGGKLLIITAPPISSEKKAPVVYDANGVRTSSAQLVASEKLTRSSVVLDLNAAPGLDFNLGFTLDVHSGGFLAILGDIFVGSAATFNAGAEITMGASTIAISAQQIGLFAAGNIGAVGSPIRIDTPTFQAVASKGDIVNINTLRVGTVQVDNATAGSTLIIDAPNSVLTNNNNGELNAPNIALSTFSISNLLINGGAESFALATADNTFDLNGAAFEGTKALTLTIAGSVGVAGSPLDLNDIGTANILADDMVVVQSTKKSIDFTLAANNDITLAVAGSSRVSSLTTSGGDAAVIIGAKGTMTFGGNVTADTSLDISAFNTTDKVKLVFEPGVVVQTTAKTVGLGDISISVGPAGAPLPTTPVNVQVVETGGNVDFTGSGVKASAPVNTVTAQGADVTINNGLSAGNIVFGGGVQITADPPVAPGTPTFVEVGATRTKSGEKLIYSNHVIESPRAVGALLSGATAEGGALFSVNGFPNQLNNLNLLPLYGASEVLQDGELRRLKVGSEDEI